MKKTIILALLVLAAFLLLGCTQKTNTQTSDGAETIGDSLGINESDVDVGNSLDDSVLDTTDEIPDEPVE